MKKTAKLTGKSLVRIVLAAAIVAGAAACKLYTNDDSYQGRAYFGSTISISDQQVWERNYIANRLSQMYDKFEGDTNVVVVTELGEQVGLGAIRKGILDFTVHEPEYLLNWKDLKVFFEIMASGVGWDTVIDVPARGTFILSETSDGKKALQREGVSGTTSSFSGESVYFVYVDRNCKITGGYRRIEQFAYTLNAFALNLSQGWNAVYLKQTYTSPGNSIFTMEIKNPDLRWVLMPLTL